MKSCLLETDGTGDDDIKQNETQKDSVAIFSSCVESEFKFTYTCREGTSLGKCLLAGLWGFFLTND